jgi:hypothetical protein
MQKCNIGKYELHKMHVFSPDTLIIKPIVPSTGVNIERNPMKQNPKWQHFLIENTIIPADETLLHKKIYS